MEWKLRFIKEVTQEEFAISRDYEFELSIGPVKLQIVSCCNYFIFERFRKKIPWPNELAFLGLAAQALVEHYKNNEKIRTPITVLNPEIDFSMDTVIKLSRGEMVSLICCSGRLINAV